MTSRASVCGAVLFSTDVAFPDTFENVIKALVKPVKKGQEGSKAK